MVIKLVFVFGTRYVTPALIQDGCSTKIPPIWVGAVPGGVKDQIEDSSRD
jgi:hypothetical protein